MVLFPWFGVYFLVIYAFAGMAIGGLTALLVSLALKLNIRGIIKDGLLGWFGFLLGFFVVAFIPWHQNTITYYEGDTLITSTMNWYQHPIPVGFVLAGLLPLLHTLYRLKRSKVLPRS
jgi:hypothetical protein